MAPRLPRLEPLRPIHRTVRWHTAAGYAMVSAAVLVSGYWPTRDPGFHYPLLWVSCALAFAAAVTIAALPAIVRSVARFAAVTGAAGLLIGLAVVATGGARSHMLALSLGVAVAGAALLPARGAFAVVAAAAASAALPLVLGGAAREAREALVLTVAIPIVGSFVHAIKSLTVREGTERRYFKSLLQASRFSIALDLDESLRAATDGIKRALDAHQAALYLFDPEEATLVPRVVRTSPEALMPDEGAAVRSARYRVGEGLVGWVAQARQPVLTGDAQADPREHPLPGLARRGESAIVVPLEVGERLVGVLRVSRVGRDHFRPGDVEIATLFANQAAIAVENSRLYAEARRLAITDGLTGLFNGRHLQDRMQAELARARRHGHPLSLAMIDSDSLKSINDRFGHAQGDRMLVQLARCIRAHVRESDVVFRYAGDEFIVLLPETDAAGAHVLLDRIRQAVQDAGLEIGAELVRFTISAGVASYPQHAETAEGLVRAADDAMYRAKQQGKNLVLVAPRVA